MIRKRKKVSCCLYGNGSLLVIKTIINMNIQPKTTCVDIIDYHIVNVVPNLIVYSVSMQDLTAERLILLNMNLTVCLESGGPFVVSTQIFKNTLIQKPLCDFSRGLKAEGIDE